MNDLYRALFGKSWTDDLAMAQRAKTEAGARQPRSFRSAGKASVRNVVKSAHGSKAAVFKRIRAGGCKGPRALAAQIAYVNDKAHAVFRSDGVMEPNGLTMTEAEKLDLVGSWSANWRGSSKLGFTSHMLLSFPQGTNPGIVKAIAEDWTEHLFDKGLYGDRWQYMVAIHTDRDHPHAHIILNNRGEDHGTWFSCWEKGVMSPQLMREKQAEFGERYGLQLDATTRLERGIFAKPAGLEEIYLAKAEGRTAAEIALTPREMTVAKAAVYEFSKEYKSVAEHMKRLDYVAMSRAVEQMADALSDGQPWADTAERILSMKDLNDYSTMTVAEGVNIASNALTALIERSEELEGRERIEFELKVVPMLATLSSMVGDAEQHTAFNTRLENTYPPELDPLHQFTLSVYPELLDSARSIGLDPEEILARLELGGTENEGLAQRWIDRDVEAVQKHLAPNPDLSPEEARSAALSTIDDFYLGLPDQIVALQAEIDANQTVLQRHDPDHLGHQAEQAYNRTLTDDRPEMEFPDVADAREDLRLSQLGERLVRLADTLDNPTLSAREEMQIGRELGLELTRALGNNGMAMIEAGETQPLEHIIPNQQNRLHVVSEYLHFASEMLEPENPKLDESFARVSRELAAARGIKLELDDDLGME